MIRKAFRCVIVCSMALTTIGIDVPAFAQAQEPKAAAQPAGGTPASAAEPHAAAPKSASTPDVPSAEILKKARNAGYHTRVKLGEVYYCKTQTDTGSRFSKEECLNEVQLEQHLLAQQGQRDALSSHPATYPSGR